MIQIKIPRKVVDYIEALNYEMEARESIINSLVKKGRSCKEENFKELINECVSFRSEYRLAIEEMLDDYVRNSPENKEIAFYNFNLTFSSGILNLLDKDGNLL